MLSGFLITGILYDAKGRDGYFRTFYIRRVLRIFPLYYGVLLVSLFIVDRISPTDLTGVQQANAWWYWTYLGNIDAAINTRTIGVAWSLAIEEHFYLVWPAVVLLTSRRQLLAVTGALVIAALLWRTVLTLADASQYLIYTLTPSHLDALGVGAFIALAVRGQRGLAPLRPWALSLGLFGVMVLLLVLVRYRSLGLGSSGMQTVGYTAFALVFGALLVGALDSPAIARLLSTPFLRWFGTYSYAIYLFHQPWELFVRQLYRPEEYPVFGGSMLVGQMIFDLIAIIPVLGAAWLSWHFFELRFLSLKHRFEYGRKPNAANAVNA